MPDQGLSGLLGGLSISGAVEQTCGRAAQLCMCMANVSDDAFQIKGFNSRLLPYAETESETLVGSTSFRFVLRAPRSMHNRSIGSGEHVAWQVGDPVHN